MAVHEIARRLIGGVWRTVDVEEDGGGNGGSQPTYADGAIYNNGAPTTITNSQIGNLPWGALGSGIEQLDATDPTGPTVLVEGIYSVSVVVIGIPAFTAGGYHHVILHLDRGDQDAVCEMDSRLTNAGGEPGAVGLNNTYYIPAGGVVGVTVANHDGASQQFVLQEASVQRLS